MCEKLTVTYTCHHPPKKKIKKCENLLAGGCCTNVKDEVVSNIDTLPPDFNRQQTRNNPVACSEYCLCSGMSTETSC